ncbi:MAG: RnfABCDGE type electron transport complex subunit B [Ruminiclostridium sp.]|nr:RnfABCDGE type electron transport complex subunit B [Ruminiclostridium sp.]
MAEYVLPILFFLVIGAVIGVLLTAASKVFYVRTDETVQKISDALPGANCGGCGYSGCDGYARAVAAGEAPADLCKPGGAAAAKKIGGIMGIEVGDVERVTAFVRCNGNCGATEDKYTYIGSGSCAAIERFYNGKGKCRAGCHGMGDCVKVCENGCISIVNGVSAVDPTNCTGCGKCVRACPNKLIVLIKESQRCIVRCSSLDTGKETRQICKNGCIACGICVKKCPSGAIAIDSNHALIDPNKCTGCGVCVKACPVKCITAVSAGMVIENCNTDE